MTRLTASKVRNDFADVLNRVAYGGERVVLHRRGKNIAAIIPMAEYELLERTIREAEDRRDLDLIRKAESCPGGDAPYEQVRRELGL